VRREQGQATVELALLLPLLAAVTLAVVQVGAVARDRVALTHVAREAAREAVVDPSAARVRAAAVAASSLDPSRLRVVVHPGDLVEVVVTYRSPTSVPLVGALVGDVTFTERLVGRAEGP
jgi:Flp pilus assembly protein TadG